MAKSPSQNLESCETGLAARKSGSSEPRPAGLWSAQPFLSPIRQHLADER